MLMTDFLVRHASTLRDLTLPPIFPSEEHRRDLSSVRLRYLQASYAMASYLSCPHRSSGGVPLGISTVDMDELCLSYLNVHTFYGARRLFRSDDPHQTQAEFAASSQWRFNAIKALTFRCAWIDRLSPSDFHLLPLFFPALEYFELDCTGAVMEHQDNNERMSHNINAWNLHHRDMIACIPSLRKVVTRGMPYENLIDGSRKEFSVSRGETVHLSLESSAWVDFG